MTAVRPVRLLLGALVVALGAATVSWPVGAVQDLSYAAWDAMLKRYVDAEGRVDYASWQANRQALDDWAAFLATIPAQEMSAWSKDMQLAFWINTYNTYVVRGVLDQYPLRSVKEVKGFFDRRRYRVAGRELTLNQIEAEGRALGDWRLHFGVVCAAAGCPVLRNEAYRAERVGAQLDEQVHRYLADPLHGLHVDQASQTLWASKIFKWYTRDFVPAGPLTAQALWTVIGPHVPQDKPLLPQPEQFRLKFLEYDWALNAQGR